MPTKVLIVVADSDTGETWHIDEPDADVHVEHTPGKERVTVHVRRSGTGGDWPPPPPPFFMIEECVAYEGTTERRIIRDEAEALRIHRGDAEAARQWRESALRPTALAQRSGTSVTCWRWTGTEYEPDFSWPGGT